MNVQKMMDPIYLGLPDFGGVVAYKALRNLGVDDFGWADPFYPDPSVPQHVKQAIIKSLDGEASHYTLQIGSLKMRTAVAERVKKVNGIEVDPNKNIVITSGSGLSFIYAIRPFMVPGEENEVMMPSPSYGNNFRAPILAGGKSVPVPTYPEDGYDLRIEEFEKRLTPKTKIIVLTNPNNPTTTVYKRETLEKVAKFVIKNNLILFIDQCFEDLVFDGYEMVNIITMPGMFERTILVSSFSKGMGLPGFRLAYIVAQHDIMSVLHNCAGDYGVPSTMSQEGILAALKDTSFMEKYRQEYMVRGNVSYKLLSDIPNVYCHKPESSFFLWLDTSRLGTKDEIYDYLIKNANVAITKGTSYGPEGQIGVRIVYGVKKNREESLNVVKRIREALLNYPKNK